MDLVENKEPYFSIQALPKSDFIQIQVEDQIMLFNKKHITTFEVKVGRTSPFVEVRTFSLQGSFSKRLFFEKDIESRSFASKVEDFLYNTL